MKKNHLKTGITLITLGFFGLTACSSDNDTPKQPENSGGSSSGDVTHQVPTDPDSGNHNNTSPDNVAPGNTGSSSEWTLVFEDNFEGESSVPDTQYWTLAQKGTDTWNRYMSESYDQAFQQNGYLYLYGEMKDGEYLTGGIESRDKFDFTYGQVKCRARFLRQPQGNHTGIWMMPQSQEHGKWPKSGEIDIMEHLDDQDITYSTVHFWDVSTGEDSKADKTAEVDNEDFNIYGVVWNKEGVSFTLNGEVIFTYKNDNPDSDEFAYQYPFVDPFYLILSQSLGGKGTWEGEIKDSELPSIFQIDWIKVWQKTE